VAVVVISGSGEGDRAVWKPGSKSPRWLRHTRSDSPRGASDLTGRSRCEPGSPEMRAPREANCGSVGSAEPFRPWRRPVSKSDYWTYPILELPGVIEGGMSGRNGQRKLGTTRGQPRCSRTAMTPRISRCSAKSRCACEWGGWGRLSEDGLGQHNPDPSEGPWGGGYLPLSTAVCLRVIGPDSERESRLSFAAHAGRRQISRCQGMPGAGFTWPRVSRPRPKGQPSSRTDEKPLSGMSGGNEETPASYEARFAPRSYPTEGGSRDGAMV
jgi:hypothetical protein